MPVPIPYPTVILQPRSERPFVLESAESEKGGFFSSPVFDPSGEFLAVYDSGSEMVRIFRVFDMTTINAIKPTRWPRRLSFSPGGRYLVMEGWQGWMEDHLRGKPSFYSTPRVAIDSPEAIEDNVQRIEVWDLRTGRTVPDLACDAEETVQPQAGWLWARKWAITPGARNSGLLEAHFSGDETELSALCWNGVQQRWDSQTWERLESIPPPPFWNALTPDHTVSGRSVDGRFVVFRSLGFRTASIWDRNTSQVRPIQGDCSTLALPHHLLSGDGGRIVLICSKGLGFSIRVWDLGSGKEIPLNHAGFSALRGGDQFLDPQSVAMSPDGRFVAGALPLTAVFIGPGEIKNFDLKLWSLDQEQEPATVPIDELYSWNYKGYQSIAFTPDSSMLVVCGTKLRIYRVSDLVTVPQ
jgi:WD40 repeat protein